MPSARCRMPKAAIPAGLLLALTLGVQAQYVMDSIDVGADDVSSMCHNPSGNVIYGLSNAGGFVFAIDCSSNQVVARIAASCPRWLAYDSTVNKLYCTFGYGDESLLVVEGATHQPVKRMELPDANLLSWDPAADRLYVSCTEANRVSVVDCATDTVIKRIRTSAGPMRMHLGTRHRKLYVQCYDSERLNIIDLNTLEVTENLGLPGIPEAGCYSEAADKYYCGALHDIVVVDGATDSVVKVVGIGQMGRSLSMVAVDRHSLVMAGCTYAGSDTVYVIDTAHDTAIGAIPGVSDPYGLCWSETTDLVYCASSRWDQVAVIAGDGSRMLDVLQVGDYPFAFAQALNGGVYLGHLRGERVYVIRDTVGGLAEMVQVPISCGCATRVWPNPFVGELRIECSWTAASGGVARVYALDGRLVRAVGLVEKEGRAMAHWDGRDMLGREVPQGAYVVAVAGQGSNRALVVKNK